MSEHVAIPRETAEGLIGLCEHLLSLHPSLHEGDDGMTQRLTTYLAALRSSLKRPARRVGGS